VRRPPPLRRGACPSRGPRGGATQPDACLQGANAAGREALAELLPHLPALRWVHTASAGVNHLLCPALAAAREVVLTNARGVYSSSLAEWALFAAAYFAKDLPRMLAAKADSRWAPYDVEELRGRTLGVVGFGDIGQATARLAQAYGMRVVATRRRAAPPETDAPCDEFFALDRLPALMAASDYVVMATPLTHETAKLIGREAIAAMKPTGVFVNIGRGPCVDEAALIECVAFGCFAFRAGLTHVGAGRCRRGASAARRWTCSRWSRCRKAARCGACPTCCCRRTAPTAQQTSRRTPCGSSRPTPHATARGSTCSTSWTRRARARILRCERATG